MHPQFIADLFQVLVLALPPELSLGPGPNLLLNHQQLFQVVSGMNWEKSHLELRHSPDLLAALAVL